MSRGKHSSPARCLTVWLLVTTAVLGTWSTVGGAAASLTSSAARRGTFEDLLVAAASAALVACAGWLWVVTTATVIELAVGRTPVVASRGITRRLVLAACGALVVAGVGSPALAGPDSGSGPGDHSLVGLPMPDRAAADRGVPVARPAPRPSPLVAARPAATPITVRAGDSLWSIAAAGLGPGAGLGEIDAAWRELYAANRDLIGSDPDLIRPGLDLEPGPKRKARP